MKNLEKIHGILNNAAKNPQVQITKIDDYSFNINVGGSIMVAFEKLGEIQNQVEMACSDEYALKTIYGEEQDAKFILKKK